MPLPAPETAHGTLDTSVEELARSFEDAAQSAGVVDYCRGHLGYAPGAPDCYAFADEVCTVYLPANDAWTETRRTLPGEAFPCPDAPEPPVCPRLTWR